MNDLKGYCVMLCERLDYRKSMVDFFKTQIVLRVKTVGDRRRGLWTDEIDYASLLEAFQPSSN